MEYDSADFAFPPSQSFRARLPSVREHSPGGVQKMLSETSCADAGDFQVLLGNLEHRICNQLDRIELSLQHLHSRAPPANEDKHHPNNEPSSPKAGRRMAAMAGREHARDRASTPDEMAMTFSAGSNMRAPTPLRTVPEPSLRPEWKETKSTEAVAVLSSARRTNGGEIDKAARAANGRGAQSPPGAKVDDDDGRHYWWIIPPGAHFRLCWDLSMMFIIAHDMAVVPVTLAFDTEDFTNWLFWPFLAFWTLDIPLSFLTGFYLNGRTVMRPSLIARQYLRTWFIIDLCMVAASWFEAGSQGYMLGRAGKSLRILRIMRCLQILRIAKLQKRFEEFHDRVTSDYYHILVSICKLVLTIVWLNHFIACCWWTLGVHSSQGGVYDSWTFHGQFQQTSIGFQYFSSLHWSLTQFTPAAMEVSARNLPERIFSVFILLFAMVAFSSFVSSITAAMTQLRQINSRRDVNTSMLRRYLRLHSAPMDLTLRITQFVDYRVSKQKNEIQESQVEFLKCLSKPLQMELSSHIRAPILTQHPFFHRYSEVEPEAMRQVCLDAVRLMSLSPEDSLFTEGCRCEEMFFVTSGLLWYDYQQALQSRISTPAAIPPAEDRDIAAVLTSSPWNDELRKLRKGEWCCEVSVWCLWDHSGSMIAHEMSEVLAVDVAAFAKATNFYQLVNGFSARYAGFYMGKMRDYMQTGTELTDMSIFTIDDLEEIVERAYLKRRSSEPDPMRRVKKVATTSGQSRPLADESSVQLDMLSI